MYRKTAVLVSVIFAALFIFQPALELNASGISISPPSYRTPSSGQIRFTGRWNEITSMDMNRNGIFDNLEEMMLEKEYVDIYVDYEHVPTLEDAAVLMGMGLNVTHIFTLAKAIGVNNVPVEKIWKLTNLPGVIMLEPKGEGFLLSDVATPAVMARPSELYSPFTAWELNYTGLGVNIAIVDTGIDDFHPSLVGKFVAGVDFSDFTPARQKPTDGSFDPDDLNGHGTTCAGIATGTGAPEGVYMGAAPGARLVDVRIGRPAGYNPGEITLPGQPTPGPGIVISEDACIAGIEWVVANKDKAWPGAPETNHGIDILSLSWGINVRDSSDGSDLYSRTLDAAVASGVFVANAAGNSGPDNDGFDGLAAASLSISVASSDDKNTIDRGDDVIASYSSRGPRADDGDGNPYNELRPDIAAPGTNIIQAEYEQVGDGSGGGYGPRGSGTSYAAPVIAGVLAMMLEANGNLTPDVGREILRATAERRDPPTFPDLDPFWNRDWGWGLVNAYRAVRLSELTTDVPSIDTNLQCFVMDHNITQNTAVISGMAWSRGGNVSSVEYRVAGGEWKTATGNGDGWDSWQVTLDLGKIPLGNQTIEIRAVGGEKYSLVDWVVAEGTGASFGMDVPFDFWGNIGYLAAAAAVIVLGYGTWRAMKDRKSTGHAGNVIAQEKPENPQIDMSPEVEAETKEPSS